MDKNELNFSSQELVVDYITFKCVDIYRGEYNTGYSYTVYYSCAANQGH